jgi:methylenetetrahydrofolate dehydrogenase (NADP+)/methenyltetrahydrofolate cyclohydrolase
MTTQILSGNRLSAEIAQILKTKVAAQTAQGRRPPQLAVVLVGEDPASRIYVRRKQEVSQQIGITSTKYHLPETADTHEVLDLIQTLNQDINTDGILVQMPLPAHLQNENIKEKIIEHIHPRKDVDGFHPYNLGRLAQGYPLLRPCTPYGIIKLLQYYEISLKGLHAVVVGASTIVGRPLALELLLAGATVTICHSKTVDLKKHIQAASLLISATGRRNLIAGEWIKKDAIVVDVGIHRLDNGTLCGDMDFESAAEHASYITPVPGGVGPMTVAMLMENTWQAYLSFQEEAQ